MKSTLYPDRFFVVIPCYNCGEFIDECLDSLKGQTFTGWTALVTDDCSTDDTPDRIREYLDDKRILYRRGEKREWLMGNTLAGLWSLDLRAGDMVAILDGDDSIFPTCLETLWEAHCQGYDIVHTDEEIDGVGHSLGAPLIPGIPVRQQSWRFSHIRSFKGHLFSLMDDDTFRDSEGKYFRAAGDLALYLPMAELAGPEKIRYIPEPLYRYRVHDNCNFLIMRDEQVRNNWDIRSRPALNRQTKYFDYVEVITELEKTDIATRAREIREKYPRPASINMLHRISLDEVDSWRPYHGLWLEEGVFFSGDVTDD